MMTNQPTTEELTFALAAVAQGCINIAEGLTTIEKDSRIYQGMETLCRLDPVERINKLEAENTRLRVALEKIKKATDSRGKFCTDGPPNRGVVAYELSSAALGGE